MKTMYRTINLHDFAPLTGTDWTASLKEAIAYLKARYGGGVLVVPGGIYKISDTITISQVRGMVIRGEGAIATDFEWIGDPTLPMFTFNRTQGCYLENISITARSAFPLLEGVRIQQGPNNAADPHHPRLSSSLMTVRDMIFRGQGALGVGVRVFLFDALNDDKNDFHRFERLQISGCTWAGLVLEGRNAKNLCLYHVDMVSTASGIYSKYGVLTLANFCPGDPGFNEDLALAAPLYNHGASFSWFGGAASGCSRSNVMLGDHNDAILVAGVYSEKSGRWLHVPAYPSGVAGMVRPFPVTLDSCRYGTAGANPNLPADGELVIFQADGPLTIRGCPWGDRVSCEQLRLRVESHIRPGTFVYQGNSISNDGDGNVFVAETPSNPDYQVTNRGYRAGSHARLGAGVTIPTDGPSIWYYPETSAQWGMVDGTGTAPAPDSQWLTSVTVTGAVADIIGSYPLIAEGTLEYQQELTTSFTKTGIHFAEVSGEKLTPNTNDYNPATDSIAWKVDAKITTSGGSRVLIAMGNGDQTAGGGAIQLKIRSDGKAEIFVDGSVRATGSFTYGSVHRFLFVLDRDQGATTPRPTVYLFTDQEMIFADVSGMTITNNSTKCIGANNGLPPDCIVLDPAVWEGQDKIDVILTTAWRSAMSVDTPAVNTDTIAERRSGGGITLLGQNIKAILSFTAAVDLPNLGAGATALVTVTATGVKTGDRLIFHPNRNGPGPASPTTTADLVIGPPWISADDQISFIVHNPTGSSIDSSNRTWHGLVFRP